ncbi:hypothetical protein AOQ84DRAFT_438885 [Glonium stellatum]|uniref:Uncharacterized protein n=1 Tax=Glonium stellatum TaxID=574774 RepID=A0A8E2F2W2_9PEZI|nr:hypothetical protein AOQ84DRAFT_438885 [Glonium stellatum]
MPCLGMVACGSVGSWGMAEWARQLHTESRTVGWVAMSKKTIISSRELQAEGGRWGPPAKFWYYNILAFYLKHVQEETSLATGRNTLTKIAYRQFHGETYGSIAALNEVTRCQGTSRSVTGRTEVKELLMAELVITCVTTDVLEDVNADTWDNETTEDTEVEIGDSVLVDRVDAIELIEELRALVLLKELEVFEDSGPDVEELGTYELELLTAEAKGFELIDEAVGVIKLLIDGVNFSELVDVVVRGTKLLDDVTDKFEVEDGVEIAKLMDGEFEVFELEEDV